MKLFTINFHILSHCHASQFGVSTKAFFIIRMERRVPMQYRQWLG